MDDTNKEELPIQNEEQLLPETIEEPETKHKPEPELIKEPSPEPSPESIPESSSESSPELIPEQSPELIKEPSKNKPPKTTKIPKQKKQPYEGICTKCTKIFKTKESYEKHTLEQTCYKSNEITYCKICLYTYENHLQYERHLFSMEHLNNIGFNEIDRIKTNEVAKVHLADPYLTNNDVNNISKKNLGNSFTFVFNSGDTQTIELSTRASAPRAPLLNNSITEAIQTPFLNDKSNIQNYNSRKGFKGAEAPLAGAPSAETLVVVPSVRQGKIIAFLERQTSIEESGKNFYKMLDNKLQLEDYKGLQTMIKSIKIGAEFKDNYIKVIEAFIAGLVKQRTSGIKVYKDKDIEKLVCNLTS